MRNPRMAAIMKVMTTLIAIASPVDSDIGWQL